jgi:histidinol-phosphate aminotransferase
MVPYVPGEQPKDRIFIKLNTNENPYPPSEKALMAIQAAADERLRLYPAPGCEDLRQAIAQHHGLLPDQVFPGNGSDEVLAFCFQAFFDPDRTVLFPDITYSFYPVYANFFDLAYHEIPLRDNFDLPVTPFCGRNGGVVIANPNAPTGKSVGLENIRTILDANPEAVVLVDEAYVDFGGISAISLISEYDNLVVVRTLSKSHSLAGLRVGYALGNPNLIAALCCVRDSINSYTLDRVAQAGAAAAIRDESYFLETVEKVIHTRDRCSEELKRMGFIVPESSANFIFISHPALPATKLMDGLRKKGILVRHFDRPRISNYLRVSIGTDQEMDALCAALEKLLESGD